MTATLMLLISTEVKQQERGGFKGNSDHLLTLNVICLDRRREKKNTNKRFCVTTRQRIVFTIKCRCSSTYPCARKVARNIYRSDDSPAPRLYSRCKSPRAGRVSSLFIMNVIMPSESTTAWKPSRAAQSDHRGTQIQLNKE